MITYKNKKLYKNDKEILINSAEIHYFRVPEERWEQTILDAKEVGMNTIASYIPWFIHENTKDGYEFDGANNWYTNLIKFLELCDKHQMMFFARPGPYIMAEFMNEGLPDYIFEIPEITPYSWNGKTPIPPVVDYLNSDFLIRVQKWFNQLETKVFKTFDNIIINQLCNEIGMLHWVSNSPDLTTNSKQMFENWVEHEKKETVLERYDVSLDDIEQISDEKILIFHDDFHRFSRFRYCVYVDILASYWTEISEDKYLYLVNIHGCGDGRSLTYPYGISQLIESYKDKPQIISGSDIYLSDVGVDTVQDIYFANAFTAASNGIDQPLTSAEFSDGDSNYANSLSSRTQNSSLGMKIDMFYLQENKMLNYYTFAGGINSRLEKDYDNGFNRFSFTGEHHGFACPIGPNGERRLPFYELKDKVNFYNNFNNLIAKMEQTVSNVKIAFMSEYYLNEYHLNDEGNEADLINSIKRVRDDVFFSTFGRAMLLTGYSFNALDVSSEDVDADVLIVPSAKYMSKETQNKLANAISSGVRIIFYGEVPEYDLHGAKCEILKDKLKIKIHGEVKSNHIKHTRVSVKPTNYKAVETHTHHAQLISAGDSTDLFEVYGSEYGAGIINEQFAFISCKYRCDLEFINNLMDSFNVRKNYYTDYPLEINGIMASSLKYQDQQFIYIFNFDDVTKEFTLYNQFEPIFRKSVKLAKRESLILPYKIDTKYGKVLFADAKLEQITEKGLLFKSEQKFVHVELETNHKVKLTKDIKLVENCNNIQLEIDMRLLDGSIEIEFEEELNEL